MSNKKLTAVWSTSPSKGTKLLLLLSLADRADDDGYCWPSQSDTARRIRAKRTYVSKLEQGLEEDGELLISKRPGTNSLYIVPHGSTPAEIKKALMHRFRYPLELAEVRLSELLTRPKIAQVMAKVLTPPVNPDRHEPSLTIINPNNLKRAVKKGRGSTTLDNSLQALINVEAEQ